MCDSLETWFDELLTYASDPDNLVANDAERVFNNTDSMSLTEVQALYADINDGCQLIDVVGVSSAPATGPSEIKPRSVVSIPGSSTVSLTIEFSVDGSVVDTVSESAKNNGVIRADSVAVDSGDHTVCAEIVDSDFSG